jgi:hypothetical protein
VDTTDAHYAVDQEDLSEKPVSAGFVSGPLLPKASFPVLPSQAGNQKTILTSPCDDISAEF